MKFSLFSILFLIVISLISSAAFSGDLTIHVGPPSLGNGGSNPISIPPTNIAEYEITWLTDGDFESNIAISPGLLFGNRNEIGSVYFSLGGGLVIDANGSGPGIYSSMGYSGDGTFAFNAEVKQALGYDFGREVILAPYAIRIGAVYRF